MTVKKVTPEQMLEHVTNIGRMVDDLNGRYVAVGLPSEKISGKLYGDGRSIVDNAVVHEFGSANGVIPERSFLRMPFKVKNVDMGARVLKEFQKVIDGAQTTTAALGRIGVGAVDIVKQAFRTGGFGNWKKLKQETIDRKGFSDILEDSRVMRNSVTSVVRND